MKSLSRVRLFATPWTLAHQAPPSMGFSRKEYWSGLLFPSPGDLLDPGIKPRSPAFQADALTSEPPGKQVPTKLVGILQKGVFLFSFLSIHSSIQVYQYGLNFYTLGYNLILIYLFCWSNCSSFGHGNSYTWL